MHIEGRQHIAAPTDAVWEAINDPEVLGRCLPGASTLEPDGEDRYHAQLKVGVGPVRGTFDGRIEVKDKKPPEGLTLAVEAKSPTGTVKAEGRVAFSAAGDETDVAYAGDVQLFGPLAGLGNRVMQGVAKTLAQQFFKSLEREVRQTQE